MHHCLTISGSLTKQNFILEEAGVSQEQSLLKELPTIMRTTGQVQSLPIYKWFVIITVPNSKQYLQPATNVEDNVSNVI